MSQSFLAKRWERLVVKRPRGHLSLLARLKATELLGDLTDRRRRHRVGGRYALLRFLPCNADIAEVGVWRGRFSELLREELRPRQLLLVDPWSDDAEEVPWHGLTQDLENARTLFEEAYQTVVGRFASAPDVRIVRAPSTQAALEVPDGSLDVVYIDGAHTYADVCADLRAWHPKLRRGGLLTGDDYYWSPDTGRTFPVRQAVDEFIGEVKPARWAAFRGQFIIQEHTGATRPHSDHGSPES